MERETPFAADNQTRIPLTHYRERLCREDPAEIARRTGASWDGGGFVLKVLGEERRLSWPELESEGWTDKERILFARYLLEGRRAGSFSGFVTYRELPWGEVYDSNFRGRCIRRLSGQFGSRPAVFCAACVALGGRPVESSGTAYEFCFLPGLLLRFILWEGDEEFPANAQILFSDNFPDAFAAEDRVVVCEVTLAALKRLATAR